MNRKKSDSFILFFLKVVLPENKKTSVSFTQYWDNNSLYTYTLTSETNLAHTHKRTVSAKKSSCGILLHTPQPLNSKAREIPINSEQCVLDFGSLCSFHILCHCLHCFHALAISQVDLTSSFASSYCTCHLWSQSFYSNMCFIIQYFGFFHYE